MQDKKRQLPKELAIFIVSPRRAPASAYAHAKTDKEGKVLGIVHRDVSPKNVMIAFEGDVKLTDFGIAKARGFLTDQEGEVVAGKADFMSPEQADFQITDKRSDLFSAGVGVSRSCCWAEIFSRGRDGRGIAAAHHDAAGSRFPRTRFAALTIGLNEILQCALRGT